APRRALAILDPDGFAIRIDQLRADPSGKVRRHLPPTGKPVSTTCAAGPRQWLTVRHQAAIGRGTRLSWSAEEHPLIGTSGRRLGPLAVTLCSARSAADVRMQRSSLSVWRGA